MKDLLDRIIENRYCLGCGLCVSQAGTEALEMTLAADGFFVPRRKAGAADMSFLRDACPGITLHREGPLKGPEKIFGSCRSLRTAHATDPDIRRRASSGGCITALLVYLLESGRVDGVLHIGKAENGPLENMAHFSRSREEIVARTGSRYAPASLLAGWQDLLKSGVRLAVVGKPCDIAAVSHFLRRHPEYQEQVVCRISFLCMGMPSQNATEKLVAALGLSPADVRDFWYRGNGWPGQATAVVQDGSCRQMSYNDSWGKILSKDVNFRCKICPDGFGEFADIACGDAWHIENGKPSFTERPGRSLAFLRTMKGQCIFEDAEQHGYLKSEPYDVRELPVIQASQYQRKIHVGVRWLALKLLGDRLLKFSGFPMFSNLGQARVGSIIRNFWGTIRRRLAA